MDIKPKVRMLFPTGTARKTAVLLLILSFASFRGSIDHVLRIPGYNVKAAAFYKTQKKARNQRNYNEFTRILRQLSHATYNLTNAGGVALALHVISTHSGISESELSSRPESPVELAPAAMAASLTNQNLEKTIKDLSSDDLSSSSFKEIIGSSESKLLHAQIALTALVRAMNNNKKDASKGMPDTDGDGIPNAMDSDADNDGVPNSSDDDIDGDGVSNSVDDDIDGDGMDNSVDDDTDGDGIDNSNDADEDADGVSDDDDADDDGDGVSDDADEDDDGDGTSDDSDDDADDDHGDDDDGDDDGDDDDDDDDDDGDDDHGGDDDGDDDHGDDDGDDDHGGDDDGV